MGGGFSDWFLGVWVQFVVVLRGILFWGLKVLFSVKAYAAEGNAAVLALQAGNDLVVTGDYRTQIPRVIQAVKDGTLEESVVDAACLRVLRWKLELGLLELAEDGTLERNFQIWN